MGKERFEHLSDEQIVCLAKSEDEAVDFLMEKYKNFVRSKARTMFLVGGDTDDLIQEGMIGLYRAIRDYDANKNTSFATFANLCIARQIYTAIKASNRQKNIPLNTYISFYSTTSGQDGENFLLDELREQTGLSPEDIIIDKENVDRIYEIFRDSLSKLEKKVLERYLGGMTYTEIAYSLKREPKSIDNALQRIKGKLAKVEV